MLEKPRPHDVGGQFRKYSPLFLLLGEAICFHIVLCHSISRTNAIKTVTCQKKKQTSNFSTIFIYWGENGHVWEIHWEWNIWGSILGELIPVEKREAQILFLHYISEF